MTSEGNLRVSDGVQRRCVHSSELRGILRRMVGVRQMERQWGTHSIPGRISSSTASQECTHGESDSRERTSRCMATQTHARAAGNSDWAGPLVVTTRGAGTEWRWPLQRSLKKVDSESRLDAAESSRQRKGGRRRMRVTQPGRILQNHHLPQRQRQQLHQTQSSHHRQQTSRTGFLEMAGSGVHGSNRDWARAGMQHGGRGISTIACGR